MEDYQKRIVADRNKLDGEIIGLTKFIFSEYCTVSWEERMLMENRLIAMIEYRKSLTNLIFSFAKHVIVESSFK